MSKFSVRKPITVLVAVVIILVLGFVSYTNMTPDLLPSIEMPYVVLVTTYPGASPEKVETEVSKPLEQSLATLEHLESVSSTSSENFSMIMLGFEESANLDAATVDILQQISLLEGSWNERIQTPTILKLNPNMLPVSVVAVEVEGQDAKEISDFVETTLLSKLEGVPGVASVSAGGLIEQTIDVQLDPEKIAQFNQTIRKAIDGKFSENQQELDDAKADTEEKLDELESGKEELTEGSSAMAQQFADAEKELALQEMNLSQTKTELKNQIASLETEKAALEEGLTGLRSVQSNLADLTAAQTGLAAARQTLDSLLSAETDLENQIRAIESNGALTAEQKAAAVLQITQSEAYVQVKAGIRQLALHGRIRVPQL